MASKHTDAVTSENANIVALTRLQMMKNDSNKGRIVFGEPRKNHQVYTKQFQCTSAAYEKRVVRKQTHILALLSK